MNAVLPPASQADLILDQRQERASYNHGAKVMDTARSIGRDSLRLASALRSAPPDLLQDLTSLLIARYDDEAIALAVTRICVALAPDEL